MTVLSLHSEPVQDTWLDAYGHLNEACYLVAFSNAAWPFQDHFGIGTDYFDETGCAMYTLESHLRYVAEVRAPALLDIKSMVLGFDAKRIHLGHVMMVDGTERATVEMMLLHYDTRAGRTAPMPETTLSALKDAVLTKLPEWSGSRVGLSRKK